MIGGKPDPIKKISQTVNLPNQHKQVEDQVKQVTTTALNAQKDNQYYQKLSAEENTETEKSKKKHNFAKYVPAMAGALLLTSAAGSIAKSGDVTKPLQDIRDGVKRVPAAIVNKFSKTSAGEGVVKGARKGVQASKNTAKPKVNDSPMANYGLGLMKGVGQITPFLAGSIYLDHKVKQAKTEEEKKNRKRLADVYDSAHPLTSVSTVRNVKSAAQKSKSAVKAIVDDRRGAHNGER